MKEYYSKEWKEFLINELKVCAKVLDDNAEEIIGKYMFTGDLDIMISLNTSKCEEFPRISITKEYYPDYNDLISKIPERRHREYREKIVKEKNEDILKVQDAVEVQNEICRIYSDDDCGDSK